MTADLMQVAGSFGGPGLLIAYMIWDRTQQNRLAEKRTAADVAMAQAMTLLSTKLDNLHAR